MAEMSKEQAKRREKTLLFAALLSSPGPFFTGWAAISSSSSTQLADFIRRSVELIALFVSWWVFRYIQRNPALSKTRRAQLERMAELCVAMTMISSGLIMLTLVAVRFSTYEPAGNVTAGLIIAVLGLITNSWFWRRYTAMTHEQYDPVIAAQQRLYRAKALLDLCVVAALTAVTIAPEHPITKYIDIIGSVIVAIYLIYSGGKGSIPSIKRYAMKRPGQESSS